MIKLFGIYISKAVVLLAVAEILILFTSLHGAILLHFQLANHTYVLTNIEANLAVIYSLVMFSSMTALGLYQKGSMATSSGFLLRIILAFFVGGSVMALLLVVVPMFDGHGRSILTYALTLSILGVLVARTIFVRVTSDKILKRRVLVLGVGINADRIEESIKKKIPWVLLWSPTSIKVTGSS